MPLGAKGSDDTNHKRDFNRQNAAAPGSILKWLQDCNERRLTVRGQCGRIHVNSLSRHNSMTENPYEEPSLETATSDVKKPSGFRWWKLALVLGIVGVLISLFLPTTRRVRIAARRTQCRNNLKQIGLALHNYHDAYQAFPPGYTVDSTGKPLHSWRTLILPYLDQRDLFETIDLSKPWDDPVNATAYETNMNIYQCPSVAELRPGHTTYLGLVGLDRCFLSTESRKLSDFTHTSGTLVATEVSPEDAVHWMAPQDADGKFFLTFDESTELVHINGLQALCADGSVTLVSPDTPPRERRDLLSVAKGEPTAADKETTP